MAKTQAPKQPTLSDSGLGRIPILDIFPSVPGQRWLPKAFAGEVVPFGAVVFREGHDAVGARVEVAGPSGQRSERLLAPLEPGTDRYGALEQLGEEGLWRFRIRAYSDDFATWQHTASIKLPAGIDVDVTLAIGRELFEAGRIDATRSDAQRVLFGKVANTLGDATIDPVERLDVATSAAVLEAIADRPFESLTTFSEWREITVERERAGSGSWYEFFPRSIGAKKNTDGSWTSGTFRTAARRLPEVAAMGFDVLYMPPIHPIGRSFRKGPNNSLDAGPYDPGSPWAIGGAAGGHDAIHPDLGTVADFSYFLKQAAKAGLEVALDFALQASPDHPWVTEHPEWFTTLPDGSIAYAENPPKKYQDIYPINFDNDPKGIRRETLRLLRYWIKLGVRIFRVDNPHTKPLDFWEYVIHTINAEFPEVVFLAEAFTRPAIMQGLAKVGYQQSYTYFTWRNTKEELEEFLNGLSHETDAFFRPNLWVNTPDILTQYLQFGGRAAYKIRAAIAATAAPTWAVYSGYELIENVARPGAEENIDNEKYEYRPRDFALAEKTGQSIAPYITKLNEMRRDHPALRQLRNLELHWSDDDAILVYSKYIAAEFSGTGAPDAIIVVANVDPHSARETSVHFDVSKFGLPGVEQFRVTDLITGASWIWGVSHNFVRLDAFTEPVHILHVEPVDGTWPETHPTGADKAAH
ncbi:maltotransferase domain-containing protein [Agreia sp. Leaf335]|uniref:maltotransferase domain-containing protein n=1 Tax=Agreia sp. Leaf335 TaxID=1736340 RepID=UPI0009E82870|nr:maltotransferase domain-containing protein [Agreia sp. Leaf335]